MIKEYFYRGQRLTFGKFEIQFARYFFEILRDTGLHSRLEVVEEAWLDFFAAETLNVESHNVQDGEKLLQAAGVVRSVLAHRLFFLTFPAKGSCRRGGGRSVYFEGFGGCGVLEWVGGCGISWFPVVS